MPKIDFGVRPTLGADLGSREKLLRSAEALFAAKGFREVSVREIAAHAGVNSALVGYYFRGKQALFNEAYRAHAAPLAKERLRRLAAITKKGRKPSVEEVVRAYVIPWLQLGNVLRFTANLSTERWEHTKKAAPFTQRTFNSFITVLHGCLPHLSRETLAWRLHFVVGAIAFGVRVPGPLRAFSKGLCDPDNLEMTLEQIIPYATAGFCAPAPGRSLRLV
jgi:AcrR family transcriptional regulator